MKEFQEKLLELDVSSSERRHYPQRKFKTMLKYLQANVSDGEAVFDKIRYSVITNKLSDNTWKLFALSDLSVASKKSMIEYIDEMGNIGVGPLESFRITKETVGIQEMISAFANTEIQMTLQNQLINPPFAQLNELLDFCKKNKLPVKMSDTLKSDIKMVEKDWREANATPVKSRKNAI